MSDAPTSYPSITQQTYDRSRLEREEKWCDWIDQIPSLKFKPNWEVKVIPPFGGAIVRFHVTMPGCDTTISVYLDAYARLGFVGRPYWEVYPTESNDCDRFFMEEADQLIDRISVLLDFHTENPE